ncbi:hypothetical protein AB4084_36910, partial [Lysobacter sp. 2RAB21]
ANAAQASAALTAREAKLWTIAKDIEALPAQGEPHRNKCGAMQSTVAHRQRHESATGFCRCLNRFGHARKNQKCAHASKEIQTPHVDAIASPDGE